MLPLYEAKMMHLYDTRWATYEPDGSTRLMTEDEKANHESPMPRYWVSESDVDEKLAGRWDKSWFLGWRDICRATDIRTVICAKLPRWAVGNKVPLALPRVSNDQASVLQACLSSYACDFAARQKLGSTTMNFFILKQLPVVTLDVVDSATWLDRRPSAWFARRVDALNGWLPRHEARIRVRAELDAAMFHLYGLDRSQVDYAMNSFSIVRDDDRATYGTFRTKELILEAYDVMATAWQTGQPYRAPWEELA